MKILLLALIVLLRPLFANERNDWPPTGYAHVVGFCYDYSADKRGDHLVFPDGTLHRGIIKAMTVRLQDSDIQELKKILIKRSDIDEEVECYDPHHGFVFFDKDWKPVGWIEVCFSCSDFVASSKRAPEWIDLAKLETFAKKVGLPVFEDEQAYHRLYLLENPAGTLAPRPTPKGEKTDDPFAGD